MADSPTPETGTPESQSPARTPPALITTEELLQSMVSKSPEASGATPFEASSMGGSVAPRAARLAHYEYLRAADAAHRLRGVHLPAELELRAAALAGRPAVGPPPWLPHQLSPALQSVLLGWRSVYESCCKGAVLQALVGDCYAREAVFEDALVSARGQEAVYRQFALLGAAVHAVQVAPYSISVTPLSYPELFVEAPPATTPPPAPRVLPYTAPYSKSGPALPRPPGQQRPRPPPPAGPRGAEPGAGSEAGGTRPMGRRQLLHLTRVTVENVQVLQLGLPYWLAWMVAGKTPGLQINLYVTSILLVASDAPLAIGLDGGGAAAAREWPSDVTASRLAGAAAALGRVARARADPNGTAGGVSGGGNCDGGSAGGLLPAWRIVHHVDAWHNVPLVWWRLRRAVAVALDVVLSPLLLRL